MRESAVLSHILGADWREAVDDRRRGIIERVGQRTDIVLFGAGYLGQHVLKDLDSLPFRPVAFVDNNPANWGRHQDGLEVFAPDTAADRFGDDALWLITIYTNRPVITQCRELGVPAITCAELSWVLPEPHPPNLVFGTPERLAEAASAIGAAASIWADAESATEYESQIRWRFLLDYEALAAPRPSAETYFPGDLIQPLEREVYVDCGAFTGDTVEAFMDLRDGKFERIVAVEPDAASRSALQSRVDAWARSGVQSVQVEPFAAGAHRGTARFDSTGTVGSIIGSGGDTVDVAPLDEILAGLKPTYIKFDVEGSEREALVGGTGTIRANMPVLAISLYHKPEDLWDLPLLTRSLGPGYRMFLRRYSDERWETVCYAVPPERLRD